MVADSLEAVRRYLREHFPAGRLEEPPGPSSHYRIDVVTPVRRYRLFVAADLVHAESGTQLLARCREAALAWRLADTACLRLDARGASRPPPEFGE